MAMEHLTLEVSLILNLKKGSVIFPTDLETGGTRDKDTVTANSRKKIQVYIYIYRYIQQEENRGQGDSKVDTLLQTSQSICFFLLFNHSSWQILCFLPLNSDCISKSDPSLLFENKCYLELLRCTQTKIYFQMLILSSLSSNVCLNNEILTQ